MNYLDMMGQVGTVLMQARRVHAARFLSKMQADAAAAIAETMPVIAAAQILGHMNIASSQAILRVLHDESLDDVFLRRLQAMCTAAAVSAEDRSYLNSMD